jgi:hypothetical protein
LWIKATIFDGGQRTLLADSDALSVGRQAGRDYPSCHIQKQFNYWNETGVSNAGSTSLSEDD